MVYRHIFLIKYITSTGKSLDLSTGKFPALWKLASIVPIPKSSNNPMIQTTGLFVFSSIVSKILEKYIYFLIWDCLAENAPLSDYQLGFKCGRSTVSSLLSVTHEWPSLMDQHKDVMCVFFDFHKAVPHRRLMKRLADIGIHLLQYTVIMAMQLP